jgi:hypothetical protein
MSVSTVDQYGPGPSSGSGYPRLCHLRRDTGEYRHGGFLVTIFY